MNGNVYIFGAHSRGQTVKEYLEVLYTNMNIIAYLVSNLDENEKFVNDIPVLLLSDDTKIDIKASVYIATRGVYHKKIIEKLKAIGFEKIYPVTVDVDMKLRNLYMKKIFSSNNRSFLKFYQYFNSESSGLVLEGENRNISARIYVTNSIYDSKLDEPYKYLPQETNIQVGAALTDLKLNSANIYDSIGNSISEKNRQYCELTALYWIWKNSTEEIVGLVHYRRHFLLPNIWPIIMQNNNIDVILAVPLYVSPCLRENYIMRHDVKEWNFMMNYLEKELPEDFVIAKKFFNQGIYSPCNMIITRKKILDRFCEWLFPILDYVVDKSGEKKDFYQNRYPGFLSERLMSYYFDRHRDEYKVVYADKNFLS